MYIQIIDNKVISVATDALEGFIQVDVPEDILKDMYKGNDIYYKDGGFHTEVNRGIFKTIVINGVEFQADSASLGNIRDAITSLEEKTDTIQWKLLDNTFRETTKAELQHVLKSSQERITAKLKQKGK